MSGEEGELLERRSLRDQALGVLRQRLVAGVLAPGSIYSVNRLAAELGVSNSPIREAMLELQNQGLVVAVRNRGFRVVELDDRERAEILEIRMLLEVPAVTSLVGSAELAEALPRLRAGAEEILAAAEQRDVVAFLDADRRFHLALLELHGNAQLEAIVGTLRDRTRLFAEPAAVLASAPEHVELLDALAGGEAERVRAIMTQHLAHVREDWRGAP